MKQLSPWDSCELLQQEVEAAFQQLRDIEADLATWRNVPAVFQSHPSWSMGITISQVSERVSKGFKRSCMAEPHHFVAQ